MYTNKKDKRKWVAMPEELWLLIKEAALKNDRKIVQQLKVWADSEVKINSEPQAAPNK